jgi:hypothetical protein
MFNSLDSRLWLLLHQAYLWWGIPFHRLAPLSQIYCQVVFYRLEMASIFINAKVFGLGPCMAGIISTTG